MLLFTKYYLPAAKGRTASSIGTRPRRPFGRRSILQQLLLAVPLLATNFFTTDFVLLSSIMSSSSSVSSSSSSSSLLASAQTIVTYMPEESTTHEGTWLSWPHQYTYGKLYKQDIEKTWIDMTKALVASEKVHIIAYSRWDQRQITKKLQNNGIPLTKIDFLIRRTDDTWIRDNGPLFVRTKKKKKKNEQLRILDWGFNGWGFDTKYKFDNVVPAGVATKLGMIRIDLNKVVLEGGAIAVDGRGTLIATRSAVLRNKRNINPVLTQTQMEAYFKKYLGIVQTIWLDGTDGGKVDITDTHIDGVMHFGNAKTIITMNRNDLIYYGLTSQDVDVLYNAKNAKGVPYEFVYLPLTQNNVVTTYKKNLNFKGSYINFYIANKVVLMPSYNDPNDNVAQAILQQFFGPTGRTVVKIDVRNLYANGGMIHCVTQQQPLL